MKNTKINPALSDSAVSSAEGISDVKARVPYEPAAIRQLVLESETSFLTGSPVDAFINPNEITVESYQNGFAPEDDCTLILK